MISREVISPRDIEVGDSGEGRSCGSFPVAERRRNNVEIINDGTQIKSNWVGASLPSLHRIPQDNNAAQEEADEEEEKRGCRHTHRSSLMRIKGRHKVFQPPGPFPDRLG